MSDPIHRCIDNWFLHLKGDLAGGLDAILHPDVVFLSPIVFTPQEGRDITKLYLQAAGSTLADVEPDAGLDGATADADDGKFGYTKVIREGHHAMLEFETEVDGKYANGRRHHHLRRRRDDHRVQGDDAPAAGDQRRARRDEGDARAAVGVMTPT